MTTDKLSHTTWKCKYHIVFAPKYRRQVIYRQIKRDIGKILRQLCDLKKSKKGIIITVIAAVVILISAVLTEILTPGIAWLFVPKARFKTEFCPRLKTLLI